MNNEVDPSSREFFDVTQYLKLFIDKEGRWFQNGAEIIHPHVYQEFCRALEKVPGGGYRVRMGRETCGVEVEDAPFVVSRVVENHSRELMVQLNDGSIEPLDPSEVWIGEDNIPYSTVKQGEFHARFSRPAYYQLAEYIKEDPDSETFFFELGGKRTEVKKEVDRVV